MFCFTVDLRTIGVADTPIVVDFSPPIAGEIFDGPIYGEDLKYTKGRKQVGTPLLPHKVKMQYVQISNIIIDSSVKSPILSHGKMLYVH